MFTFDWSGSLCCPLQTDCVRYYAYVFYMYCTFFIHSVMLVAFYVSYAYLYFVVSLQGHPEEPESDQ